MQNDRFALSVPTSFRHFHQIRRKGRPRDMLAPAFVRLPSRQLIRGFSSSARNLDYLRNVDQKVFEWKRRAASTRSLLTRVRQGFEKALQVKDKIVIADFHAKYASLCVQDILQNIHRLHRLVGVDPAGFWGQSWKGSPRTGS